MIFKYLLVTISCSCYQRGAALLSFLKLSVHDLPPEEEKLSDPRLPCFLLFALDYFLGDWTSQSMVKISKGIQGIQTQPKLIQQTIPGSQVYLETSMIQNHAKKLPNKLQNHHHLVFYIPTSHPGGLT